MVLRLQQVVPHPLQGALNPESAIWNTQATFLSGAHYLVDAQSGKGKSTFVQCLYGIRRDYDGEVFVGDANVRELKGGELAVLRQSKLSIMFQDLRLFLDLTARENIALNAQLAKTEYADKVEEMAERLRVTHVLDKQAGLLSYGERQRVATIRALVQPFEWLLLDEPFSHLDKENTLSSYELMLEVARSQGAGIILTTLGEDEFITFEHHWKL